MNALRRRKNGRFAKGNAGGPGRPAKPAPPQPIHDATLLSIEQQINDRAEQSWWFLFNSWPRAKFLRFVAQAQHRGERVPDAIAAQLRKELEP